MDTEIENISADVIQAVKLILDPYTPNTERGKAHKVLEDFKDTSPLCAKCGFYLSSKINSSEIRHCGFQLVDNYIKLHWNKIDIVEKLWIKDTILNIIASGTNPVTIEESYVKDAISRIVVEVIKREWPQQWPSMMSELNELCNKGDEQTELVLLIFSRLVDDVVNFQNIPDKRRREVYRQIVAHLKELLAFFSKTLAEKANQYISCKQLSALANGTTNEVARHCRVALVTLDTLSCFVEWVPINHIVENRPLISLACKLLSSVDLRDNAVKCLLNLTERKGKPEERKELLLLFDEMDIFNVLSSIDICHKDNYLFLKMLLQCLQAMGTNLCFCKTQFSMDPPEHFHVYLNCLTMFLKHPNMVFCQTAQTTWLTILRNAALLENSSVTNLFPSLLKHEVEIILKCGLSDHDTFKCMLSEIDNDDELTSAITKIRTDVGDVIKIITKAQPKVSLSFSSTLLRTLLCGQDWRELINPANVVNLAMCWGAMVPYLDAVCNVLAKNIENSAYKQLFDEALELLELSLTFTSEDLVILSYCLSCTSSLFFSTTFRPELKLRIFEKIFLYLKYDGSGMVCTKDVHNLKRHASALLIKLSLNHPTLLIPEFQYLCTQIQGFFQIDNSISRFDKCALLESLIILSNSFNDFETQSNFLKEVLSAIENIWSSPTINQALESPEAFIALIGNESLPPEHTGKCISKDASDLSLAVNVTRAFAKRCLCPTSSEVATKGNFIHPTTDSSGNVFYRNPAAQIIIPIIGKIFQLLRIINSLHDPAAQQGIDESFHTINDISDADKASILGHLFPRNSSQEKQPSDYVKSYFMTLHDTCLHVLCGAIENFGIDFFTIPNLPSVLKESVLHQIEHMPPMRLRNLIRLFFKPFFLCWPSSYISYDEVLVVLSWICPFMLQKLNAVWEKFRLKYGGFTDYESEMTEVQELLEDQLNRSLSRDYISALLDIMSKSKACLSTANESMDEDNKEVAVDRSKTLNELGCKIMKTESTRSALIFTAFDSLRWLDTSTNVKSTLLCEYIISKIIQDKLVREIQEANYLLQSVLFGLQELGQHESNVGNLLSLCLSVYENLRVQFPQISETLRSCTNCDEESIRILNETIDKNSQKTKADKHVKEALKKVVSKIIGVNVGQQHKRNLEIINLPPLTYFKQKENTSVLDAEGNGDIGICSLFANHS